ncbi:hypothetical protein [Maridesulfovibrio sp.]|uniref:hypothetical protein n=1 Tax=Maridesulfovibrio sp. TaxID=2795000 RepID=UPI0029C9C9F7|nr:hypothetical protein [Maridesulfovibrio sp.]
MTKTQEPTTSSNAYDFSATAGTGGTGGAGGTSESGFGQQHVGGASASGLTPPANVHAEDFDLKKYCEEVAYAGFVGASGGMGMKGEDGEEIIVPTTVEEARNMHLNIDTMRKVFTEKIGSLDDTDFLIKETERQLGVYATIEKSANSQVAMQAMFIGFILLRLQSLRYGMNKRDWMVWADKKLPFLKKRTREKYMSLAALPGSDKFLFLGAERLAEIGSYYLSLDDDAAKELGANPIATLMQRMGFLAEESYEERKLAMDAIVEVLKLEKRGVVLEKLTAKDIENLLDISGKFTGAKRSLLVAVYGDQGENGLKQFIQLVKEENGKWDKAENRFYPESVQNDKQGAKPSEKSAPVMVASVPELTIYLSQSIKTLLDDSQASFVGVEVGDLGQLKSDIDALIDRVSAGKSADSDVSADTKADTDTASTDIFVTEEDAESNKTAAA